MNMRVKKVDDAECAKASRARHELKPELAELLELVHMLPPEQQLIPIEQPYKLEMVERRARGEVEEYASVYAKDKALGVCLKDLPERFQQYVNGLAAQFDAEEIIAPLDYGVWWYESFRVALLTLRAIASLNKHNAGHINVVTRYLQMSGVASTLTVDEQNRVRHLNSLLAEAIVGVEVDRIRECDVCRQIFWARRHDQWTCSKEHAHVLRNRRARANWKKHGERYLRTRREWKAVKKKKGR